MNEEGTVCWCVDEAAAGERVDKYVARQGEWSRAVVQRWIEEERVTSGGRAVKANYRLQAGEKICLHVPAPVTHTIEPEAVPLDIVYEDDDVLIVNKPRGMVVHPAPGNVAGTLVNALLAHCDHLSGINGDLRPGIVHRIDKDTSGLLMVAKTDAAHESLAQQLAAHTVKREYMAIVHGKIGHAKGTIDAPIGRHPKNRKEMAVVHNNGKRAVTHFNVIEYFPDFTFVVCRLETGRTHQIRVHMAYIGHPLLGDPKYGSRKRTIVGDRISGQALHAATLGFVHPRSGEQLQFHAPVPQDMEDTLAKLRAASRG
ncbi:RluA family pseudouridine synthase [Numidum massiliense]|uniref:RluA family pseudouridine synthase n=1 Tax=Numidum massiliense TaxID=1522315 RepID=UPI0006D57780|nr:RluA family pseudouridine synthase [Numidum massiliense]